MGRQDGGVVPNEDITGPKELRKIAEDAVLQRARRAVDHEQPRLIAAGGGVLRDEMRRQRVVEQVSGERRQEVQPRRRRS